MNPEKQRKMLILFLIYDQETQFTAHIIYDLLSDQTFLYENEKLADILFNSLHWKIQKIFKISNSSFEDQKKKLENISINDIPYESKILALNTSEYIKSKAIEKLKEINGSKENSIKAQQWLDGFLKIPFGIYKKEKIIDFFGKFQNKMENFINTLALKISDYEAIYLNTVNQIVFECYNDIINEFYSNIGKSENIYNNFIGFLDKSLKQIKNEINFDELYLLDNLTNQNEIENNINNLGNLKNDTKINIQELLNNETIKKLLSNDNELNLNQENLEDYKKELENFKKIKNELYNNDIFTKKNLKLLFDKLNEIENKINNSLMSKIANGVCDGDDNGDDNTNTNTNTDCQDNEDDYDQSFNKFNIKNIDEMKKLIIEWAKFKEDKKIYMQNVDKSLNLSIYLY